VNEATRAYIYRVALAVLAVAAAYGYVEDSKIALFSALLAALLPVGLAVGNTSTKG
jgi:hypothetical protein